MSSNGLENLLSAIAEDAKREKKAAKDNEIIDWVRTHWHLFTSTAREMKAALAMLGNQFTYSPDGLSMALGLPENMYFVKCKQTDVSRSMLQFKGSVLMDKFLECCAKQKSSEAIMLVVAGENSIVITNMQTVAAPGLMHLYLKSTGSLRDIHLFTWKDAEKRIPMLFEHKGEINE